MSREYVEGRIREALLRSGGNATKARAQVAAWALEDVKLLRGLAAPHLNGIIAYNVERVVSGRSRAEEKAPRPDAPIPAGLTEEEFGLEVLRALAGPNAALFGQESYAPPVKRGKASRQHIDAIRQLAAKSKTGKRDD